MDKTPTFPSKDNGTTPYELEVIFGDYTCAYRLCGVEFDTNVTDRVFKQIFNEFMVRVFKHHNKEYKLRDLLCDLSNSREPAIQAVADKLRRIMND
jgi:hypothetical protein